MEKIHETLIERKHVCTIRDIFTMKGISDYNIIKMTGEDGHELKPFELMACRPLGRNDAIVISPFTGSEIQDLIEASITDEELEAFRIRQTKEGIRHYNTHYASDDPICVETIDYMLPDDVDTSSSFDGSYNDSISDALFDSVAMVAKWLCDEKEDYLEFRAVANDYIGSGIICNDVMIREIRTKDIVIILERDEPEHSDCGFIILTAYPDITDRAITAVPTGRDIRPDLHQSNAYQNADAAEKYLLDQKALRGLTH